MQYVWASKRSKKNRVHIQAFGRAGQPLQSSRGPFAAICGIDLPFDRSINAPFSLGRKVCRVCEDRVGH